MKFNYKFPLNGLATKPPKLRFCLAKYKFYAGWIVQRYSKYDKNPTIKR